jgi:hypothetical protein
MRHESGLPGPSFLSLPQRYAAHVASIVGEEVFRDLGTPFRRRPLPNSNVAKGATLEWGHRKFDISWQCMYTSCIYSSVRPLRRCDALRVG